MRVVSGSQSIRILRPLPYAASAACPRSCFSPMDDYTLSAFAVSGLADTAIAEITLAEIALAETAFAETAFPETALAVTIFGVSVLVVAALGVWVLMVSGLTRCIISGTNFTELLFLDSSLTSSGFSIFHFPNSIPSLVSCNCVSFI